MKSLKQGITFILILTATVINAQMNFQDSSVQVISFWDLGEKYEYAVSLQTVKYTESDTLSNETITYDVEVSVIDSTENSYIVRWYYKNFTSDSENPILKKIASAAENIAVDIKTDELGIIQSVENWEEVRDYMARSFDTLRNDLGELPGMDNLFEQLKSTYADKSAIEATAIKDVHQFHNFHGGRYELNETLTGEVLTPNLYDSAKPFNTEVSVRLEELDAENDQFIIRSLEEVDSEQLTETTFNYLQKLADTTGQEFIKREDFVDLSNMVETVSRIHNTGWVLESVQWKEVAAAGTTNSEIRIILMK